MHRGDMLSASPPFGNDFLALAGGWRRRPRGRPHFSFTAYLHPPAEQQKSRVNVLPGATDCLPIGGDSKRTDCKQSVAPSPKGIT